MGVLSRFSAPRGIVCGVCTELADRARCPVWVVRALSVILGLSHPWIAILLYAAIAVAFRYRTTPSIPATPPGPAARFASLHEEFNRMERRMRG